MTVRLFKGTASATLTSIPHCLPPRTPARADIRPSPGSTGGAANRGQTRETRKASDNTQNIRSGLRLLATQPTNLATRTAAIAMRADSSKLRGTVYIQTLMPVPGPERLWTVSVLPDHDHGRPAGHFSGLDWSSSSMLADF
jgi:hypothetical protein